MLQQQTKTIALKTALLPAGSICPASSTFSYFVRQSESASIWLVLSIKLNLGLLGVRAIKPLFPLQIFRNKVVIVEALFFLITVTGTFLK